MKYKNINGNDNNYSIRSKNMTNKKSYKML